MQIGSPNQNDFTDSGKKKKKKKFLKPKMESIGSEREEWVREGAVVENVVEGFSGKSASILSDNPYIERALFFRFCVLLVYPCASYTALLPL